MKKLLTTATLSMAMVASISAQSVTTTYDLDNSKLHEFQSGDPMGNVSFIIEGEKSLVILEQPMFWQSIKEFNSYAESLDKPIDRVVANYHSLGLADYSPRKVMMPEAMITFGATPQAQGMIAKFEGIFGEAADFRPHKSAKGFKVPSTQNLAGVEWVFTEGVKGDFPAANIIIDGKACYTHFAPAIAHANPMQIKSRESIDQLLSQAEYINTSGAEYIFGSHGVAATQKEVEWQIGYLKTIKRLLAECDSSDLFGQRLIVTYPSIKGIERVKTIAKALYPDEPTCEQREALRKRMNDYMAMVSNIDAEIAEGLWATTGDVSIITPRSQFFGVESIMNDFLTKTFSSLKSRTLSSMSEVINIYGDSANIELYWRFETESQQGERHTRYGRESLIFALIDGEWRLVHVHYSPMPQ